MRLNTISLVLILITDRRAPRDKLEQVVRDEAARLDIPVELREPDPVTKAQVMLRHSVGTDGIERRSGDVFNDIPPELIDIAIDVAKIGAGYAAGTAKSAQAKLSDATANKLLTAVSSALKKLGLGKVEVVDDKDTPGYL